MLDCVHKNYKRINYKKCKKVQIGNYGIQPFGLVFCIAVSDLVPCEVNKIYKQSGLNSLLFFAHDA